MSMEFYNFMDKSYIEAVKRKLKKQGKSEEEIGRYINKLTKLNYMEEEKIETPEEIVPEVPVETPPEAPEAPLDTPIESVA